jgi:membrane protease YdiL (CAAX protease family)
VLQFFALEFFFRGFMVHGLKDKMGVYSIAAMVVPYCMIHFTKPLPECVGSLFAGLILGLLSLRTGSVWLGALIHIAVALSMDWLSLWHRGFLF